MLLLKGGGLLAQALAVRPGTRLDMAGDTRGLLIGGIKTELIFEKACSRNLERIAGLDQPRIWQAYRTAASTCFSWP